MGEREYKPTHKKVNVEDDLPGCPNGVLIVAIFKGGLVYVDREDDEAEE